MAPKNTTKAFTLIELLVSIVIIGILIAILTPVVGKARARGRRAGCASNLRQIGIAINLYVQEHDFELPPEISPGRWWYMDLEPYHDDNEIFRCPEYRYHDYSDPLHFSYAFNTNLSEATFFYVAAPSTCILVGDSKDTGEETGCGGTVGEAIPRLDRDLISTRHSKGTNLLFLDGHVDWFLPSQIPTDYGPEAQRWWNG